MTTTLFTLALALSAQTYVGSEAPAAYVPIRMIPGVTITSTVMSGANDSYVDAIDLGFSFSWFATTETQIGISSNGWVALGSDPSRTSRPSNTAYGTAPGTDDRIAIFWDDLSQVTVLTSTLGSAPDRSFVVEWSAGSASMQLWLFEGQLGRFDLRYGGSLAANTSATIGYEREGGPSRSLRPCANTASCTAADFNAIVDRRLTVQRATAPELSGAIVSAPRGARPGESATAMISIRNDALGAASDVVATVFLSFDAARDPGDSMAGTVTVPSVGGDATAAQAITLDVPASLPINDYFVILEVDEPNAFPELDEADNRSVAAQKFATAYELRPLSIVTADPDGANPGDTLTFDLMVESTGIPHTGSVEVAIFASLDQIPSANDRLIGTAPITLAGGTVESESVAIQLPAIPPGSYFPVVRLDYGAALLEINELDNAAAGLVRFATGPDFDISASTPSSHVAAGGVITIDTTITSLAVPFAGTVTYDLWLSEDALVDSSDESLGTHSVAMGGAQSVADQRMMTVPQTTASGVYRLIARVDPGSAVVEANEGNNVFVSPIDLFVGRDLSIAGVFVTPGSGGEGTVIDLSATVQIQGTPFIGFVPYRVLLSVDQLLGPGDQEVFDGFVFLNGQPTASIGDTFPLPAVQPGELYPIVLIDPSDQHREISENNNWGAGNRFLYGGADLRVVELSGPSYGFIDNDIELEVTIANDGEVAAGGFRYAYYLSEDTSIRVFDQQIFVSEPISIEDGSRETYVDTVRLPAFTSTQSLYLGIIVDVNDDVIETTSNNNIRRLPDILSILFPTPDLSVEILGASDSAAAGDQITISRRVRNEGTAPAPALELGYYLSENAAIATDDRRIGTVTVSLDPGAEEQADDVILLPWDLPGRTYYLGIIADPSGVFEEVNEANNSAVGPQLAVLESDVEFVTAALPAGQLGVEYEAGAFARGGSAPLQYSVAAGQLPDGLSLEATTGIIAGVPTREGLFEFVVAASAFSSRAEQAFSIRVTPVTVALTIATSAIPNAIASRDYQIELVAVGGNPPLSWSAAGELPPGMSLSPEGLFSGTPLTPGFLPFNVQVEDQLGARAFGELVLNVVDPTQTVLIVQNPLPTAIAGVQYCERDEVQLEASGGLPPYVWSLAADAPAGMGLSSAGSLCGTPTSAGRFPILVRVTDQAGLSDTSLFMLQVSDGSELTISTTTFSSGQVGSAYQQSLEAVGGEAPYVWSIVAEWGRLPNGLTLEGSTISGTPSAPGVFAVAVQVVDARLATDVQTRVIEIAPAPATVPDEGCGCSTERTDTRPYGSAGLLLLAALFFLRRRAVAVAPLLLFVSMERAEAVPVPGTPYDLTRSASTYQPLSNPTQLVFTAIGAGPSHDEGLALIALPFAFTYYDTPVSQIAVGTNGVIAFDAVSPDLGGSNAAPGDTGTPNGIIAAFWDDLIVAPGVGLVGFQVGGTAPARSLTIEWRNVSHASDASSRISFSIRFLEGPGGQIEVAYGGATGASAASASMGMEDRAGERPILLAPSACTDACAATDVQALVGTRSVLIRDPGVDLVAIEIVPPPLIFLGEANPVEVTYTNVHRLSLGPFEVVVLASRSADMSNAVRVFHGSMTLNGFESETIEVPAVPPAGLGVGTAYLALSIDADGQVAEVDESNNYVTAVSPVELRVGTADVVVEEVVIDRTEALPGDSISATVRVTNQGADPIASVDVILVLSSNPVITPVDGELGRINLSLGSQESRTETFDVTLPADTGSGRYYLGAVADPDAIVAEFSELNNAESALPLVVDGADLTVLTTRLPNARLGRNYDGLLVSAGGEVSRRWEVVQGSLPSGISLGSTTGQLFGRPMAVEMQSFRVRVTSGEETAEGDVSLSVVDPEAPLTIVTRAVPTAVLGQEYTVELHSAGGSPSGARDWTAAGLPDGFSVAATETSEIGLLSGTALEVGSTTVALSVSDGISTAEQTVRLEVLENPGLHIIPRMLSTARDGEVYQERLEESGGAPPVSWFIRGGELPNGIELSTGGELTGTPMEVGIFRFVAEARDAAGAIDADAFEIEVLDSGSLVIETESLPEGIAGTGYDVTLTAAGGLPPYSWTIIEGSLPDGIVPANDPANNALRLAGAPEEAATVSLLIRVVDSEQRQATKAFALRIVTPPPAVEPEKEGCDCSSSGSGGGLWSLLALGLLLLYRAACAFAPRRSRR